MIHFYSYFSTHISLHDSKIESDCNAVTSFLTTILTTILTTGFSFLDDLASFSWPPSCVGESRELHQRPFALELLLDVECNMIIDISCMLST